MIRTEILSEVKGWLEINNYEVSLDEVIEEFEDITFTEKEITEIESIFDEEEERRYQEQAEYERELDSLMIEWEAERRYQEAEYRAMVWVA